MSNFVCINGSYINTDCIEKMSFDECVLKSGQVIRGDFCFDIDEINSYNMIPAEPGATSFFFVKDGNGGFDIEEYPIVGWARSSYYVAKPVYFFYPELLDAKRLIILHGIRSNAAGLIYWEDIGYTLEELKEAASIRCK